MPLPVSTKQQNNTMTLARKCTCTDVQQKYEIWDAAKVTVSSPQPAERRTH